MIEPTWVEVEYAKRWRGVVPMATIAEALEVSELALRLAVGERYSRRPWSAEEDRILRTEYPDGSSLLLSRRLRRSIQALRSRANALGIRKSSSWHGLRLQCARESRKYRKSLVGRVRNAVTSRGTEPRNQRQGDAK